MNTRATTPVPGLGAPATGSVSHLRALGAREPARFGDRVVDLARALGKDSMIERDR